MNSTGSILLVEDDERDIEMIERAYRAAGIPNPLKVVRDGVEATAYLKGEGDYGCRDRNPFPLVVLLDLFLPGMSGLDLLSWLREESFLSRLMVVVVSVSRERADVLRAYELGAGCFVTKSATFSELMDVLKAAFLRKPG